jgi:hypothetical protein
MLQLLTYEAKHSVTENGLINILDVSSSPAGNIIYNETCVDMTTGGMMASVEPA